MLLIDEGSIKISNPEITKWDKYLLNEPLYIIINTPSYNIECRKYSTPKTLPNDKKETQPGRISLKDGNINEESHLTSSHEEHCSYQ